MFNPTLPQQLISKTLSYSLLIRKIVTYSTGMLTVPAVDVHCHILLSNAFNSTSFPANSTEVVKCCQQLFTR